MVAAAVPIALASRVLVDLGRNSLAPSIFLVLLIGAVAIASAVPWWRSLDEMQRQAQLAAWYWGGTFGTIVGILGTLVVGGVGGELVRGALLMAGAQGTGFALCWLGWRVLHQPRTL